MVFSIIGIVMQLSKSFNIPLFLSNCNRILSELSKFFTPVKVWNRREISLAVIFKSWLKLPAKEIFLPVFDYSVYRFLDGLMDDSLSKHHNPWEI